MKLKQGQIKAVIFDMDGLMFNTETLYRDAIIKMGQAIGKVLDLNLQKKMMGRSNLDSIRVLKEAWSLNEDIEKLRSIRDESVIELSKFRLQKMAGLDELLSAVSKLNLPKAVVTGSQKKVAEHFLSLAHLSNQFAFVLTGDDIVHGKPDPDIYFAAVERFKLQSDSILVFEDSLNGVISAKGAHCVTFAVPNEYSGSDDFSIADATFRSLKEIVPIIRNMGL